MITKLDVETSGNCKFADTWERLFPTAAEAGTMEQAGARSSLGKNQKARPWRGYLGEMMAKTLQNTTRLTEYFRLQTTPTVLYIYQLSLYEDDLQMGTTNLF